MIQIKLRTEYSFRIASGPISKVLDSSDKFAAGIADRNGTWGHLAWDKECRARNIKPIFGVELQVVDDAMLREKQPFTLVTFIASTSDGLRQIRELTGLATELFYYHPRIDWGAVQPSKDLKVIVGMDGHLPLDSIPKSNHLFFSLSPSSLAPLVARVVREKHGCFAASSDNYYPTPGDLRAHEVLMGRELDSAITPRHISSSYDIAQRWGSDMAHDAIENSKKIAHGTDDIPLEQAEMVHPLPEKSLREWCLIGAVRTGTDLSDPVYKARLDRELRLVEEKNYTDYFELVRDAVVWAKERMFVGPARGSSCGSLVCYLLDITDIDPIPYDLLFERFIDLNREDLPDIDIDFEDRKRDMVYDYLAEKYGSDCVSKLGTVSFFKSRSALTDCAKVLRVPQWDIDDLKGSIIERSSGDARAMFCLDDTFDTKTGREFLEKYPEMKIAGDIEGRARHTGVHAAAILVTAKPMTNYASIDERTGAAMLDKKDAERIDLLKIDALGLRTLSVLQDALDQIGMSREDIKAWPMDDQKAFDILNDYKFWGIFQYEGNALQGLVKQMKISSFEDVVSITALARPGPLVSGGAQEYVNRRMGRTPIEYLHPLAEDATKTSLGVVVYQEQVMRIAREIGKMTWKETGLLRRIISKSRGKEEFDKFWKSFWRGAKENGLEEEEAKHLWDHINTMGSWAFNRSHAVAYGMMSYWCLVLKAHHPLEFAAASLRNSKDDGQCVKILRELCNEGYEYLPYDRDLSIANWSTSGGKLIGGLTGIKGIGPKVAEDIENRRACGKPLTKRQSTLLEVGVTPWDSVFEGRDLWGHILDDPSQYNINSPIDMIGTIEEDSNGTFVVIGKLTIKNIRDQNELIKIEQRGGVVKKGQTKYLNLTIEDDTGSIMAMIGASSFNRIGQAILDDARIGEWFIWKGKVSNGFRCIWIDRWKKMTNNKDYEKKD